MRLRTVAIAAVAVLAYFAVRPRSALPAPPDPTALILGMRNTSPFRLTLGTDPEPPRCGTPITLRVHANDASGKSTDGLKIEAEVSMSGADRGAQHATLHARGNGNYEGTVNLDVAGSWDVDLTATKNDNRGRERISIEVGGAQGSSPSRNDDDDDT
jgi:hypothetical protein